MDHGELNTLTDRWAIAWARSRGREAEQVGRAWRVDVASETREVEYVVASPQPDDIEQVLERCRFEERVWLTVLGDLGPDTEAALQPLERFSHAEVMMTSDIALSAAESRAESRAAIREEGDVACATISVDGQVAAEGQAALLGTDVVFDRIRTDPEFRRRGHGRSIMEGLARWASARGARRGILLASLDGQLLYTSLGWSVTAPVSTYRFAGTRGRSGAI